MLDFDIGIQKTEKEQPLILSPEEERLIENYRDFNEKGKEKLLEEVYMMTVSGIYKNSKDISGMEA